MPRVWERFLTEMDKADLAHRGRRSLVGFGERPALVLVDLYRAAFGDRREPVLDAIKRWPSSCGPAAWDALPHLQRLLGVAREAQVPIVHVTKLTGGGVQGWTDRRYHVPPPRGNEVPAYHSEQFEIIDELAPLPSEVLIRKASPSAVWGTPLLGHLITWDIDTVIVCGEGTSGCVLATVVDLATNGFRTVVVEECVFGRYESAHAMSLFDMHQFYADVLAIDDVVAYLRSLDSGRTATRDLG